MADDIFLYATFLFLLSLFFLLFFLWYNGKNNVKKIHPPVKSSVPKKETVVPNENSVMEVFDYHGIKIIQEHGKYTVKDKDFTRSYANAEALPPKYKKMLLQLSTNAVPKNSFKMDYDGKVFKVVDAKGNIKKYKKYLSIPKHIRQKLPQPSVEGTDK